MKKIHELKDSKKGLIRLADGNVLREIRTNAEYYAGMCETCDYGARTVTTLDLMFNNSSLNKCIDYSSSNGQLFNESDLILLFTKNNKEFQYMNYEQFIKFISNKDKFL